MVRKFSKVNAPVGLVPHQSDRLMHTWRIYKYGWKNFTTHVKGPVWIGFDEIRHGLVGRDDTTYADVNPAGSPCTDGCAGLASASAVTLELEIE
jgi:hypothetical protein